MVKRDELYKAPRFKDFTRALTEICAASVRAVAAHAERANASEMSILLAGGGANLPFLASVARLNANADRNSNIDTNVYSDCNANRNANGDTDLDSNGDTDGHADAGRSICASAPSSPP
mgnify:CR=1 FL=1